VDYAVMYGFSLVFLLVVFIGSGYMMQSVIEEKENKLVEILITSVRAEQLLTGKVMAQGVMTLFQVAVWFGISYFLLQTQGDFLRQLIPFLASLVIPWQALPAMGIYLLLGFFLFASAFGAVGALTNSSQEASQYTVFFVLPAMLPYFLIGQFASDPHNPLVVGLSLFPLTAPIAMILRLSLTSVPPLEIVLSVGLLAAAVAGGFWLAGRLFRAQLLMGGKIPGPRAILTALRSG
jgi:ABC-2 type transport system permease protein